MTLMDLGNIALVIALLAAATGVLAAVAAGVLKSKPALRTAQASVFTILGAFTAASAVLVYALIHSDFRVQYVARFTEKALPVGYKLAAFWAGQEGSLLLWGWLIAAFGTIWILVSLKKNDSQTAIAIGTIAVVAGFFAGLMLFCDSNEHGDNANPFHQAAIVQSEGDGLNPMLQDPGMIAHPPLLFMGYAGFTIPFALMIGALLVRRKDNEWIAATRRWLVVSWLFLTVGILLGAQWAYVELGWGGYWAWDPVENASLLPWLTGTALLHSIMVQQQRGMLKRWNAALIALTFILCIFGTWITRSGVVQSVHSFGKSIVGTSFLVFLIVTTVFSISMIAIRSIDTLDSEHELETPFGREGMFLITDVVLVIMMVVTTIGTLFPAISQVFTGKQVAVKQQFYNNVVVPMGLVLMAMMAVGPLLSLGKDAGKTLARRLTIPACGGVAALVFAAIFLIPFPREFEFKAVINLIEAMACAFIIGLAITSLFADFIEAIFRRMRGENENPISATIRVLDGNHRRYGGQIVHIGMLMIMVGIAGSSLYNVEYEMEPAPGELVSNNNWHVRLDTVENFRAGNFDGTRAVVTITDPAGKTMTLKPELRRYDMFVRRGENQINADVAIWTNTSRDAYLTLRGVGPVTRDDGSTVKPMVAALKLLINPLVLWLWIGGIVIVFGSLVAVLPRLLPASASEKAAQERTLPPPVPPRRGKSNPQDRKDAGPLVLPGQAPFPASSTPKR